MTRATYPATWPGTAIIKSVHTAFNWRRPGDSHAPLNAGIRKTNAPNVGGTPRQPGGFGANNGTIAGLSKKAQKIIAFKPAVTSYAHNLQRIEAAQKQHGGAYSRVKVEKT